MDTNGDGTVTAEEFKAFQPHMKDGVFAMIDSNKDAGIDAKEWLTFHEEHRRSMGSGGGGMGSGGGMGGGMGGSMPAPSESKGNTGSDMLIAPPSKE